MTYDEAMEAFCALLGEPCEAGPVGYCKRRAMWTVSSRYHEIVIGMSGGDPSEVLDPAALRAVGLVIADRVQIGEKGGGGYYPEAGGVEALVERTRASLERMDTDAAKEKRIPAPGCCLYAERLCGAYRFRPETGITHRYGAAREWVHANQVAGSSCAPTPR